MDSANDQTAAMPAMSAMTVKEGFQLFDQFLKSVAEAVVEAEGDFSMKFRDRISSTTETIFSQSEEYRLIQLSHRIWEVEASSMI